MASCDTVFCTCLNSVVLLTFYGCAAYSRLFEKHNTRPQMHQHPREYHPSTYPAHLLRTQHQHPQPNPIHFNPKRKTSQKNKKRFTLRTKTSHTEINDCPLSTRVCGCGCADVCDAYVAFRCQDTISEIRLFSLRSILVVLSHFTSLDKSVRSIEHFILNRSRCCTKVDVLHPVVMLQAWTLGLS